MSHQHLSTNVLHVGSNGANTKRWFGSGAWCASALSVGTWVRNQRKHWDGYEFQTRVELQVAFIENLNR
jgi:hypothetical protein